MATSGDGSTSEAPSEAPPAVAHAPHSPSSSSNGDDSAVLLPGQRRRLGRRWRAQEGWSCELLPIHLLLSTVALLHARRRRAVVVRAIGGAAPADGAASAGRQLFGLGTATDSTSCHCAGYPVLLQSRVPKEKLQPPLLLPSSFCHARTKMDVAGGGKSRGREREGPADVRAATVLGAAAGGRRHLLAPGSRGRLAPSPLAAPPICVARSPCRPSARRSSCPLVPAPGAATSPPPPAARSGPTVRPPMHAPAPPARCPRLSSRPRAPARRPSCPPPPRACRSHRLLAPSSRRLVPAPPPPRDWLGFGRARDWGWLGRHGIGGGGVLSLRGIFLFFYRNNRGPTRQMQVDAQVDEQVGKAPPSDRWTPRTQPHPSLTYWLKYPVQKETP
jgi:hypothetical protein